MALSAYSGQRAIQGLSRRYGCLVPSMTVLRSALSVEHYRIEGLSVER